MVSNQQTSGSHYMHVHSVYPGEQFSTVPWLCELTTYPTLDKKKAKLRYIVVALQKKNL